MVMTITHIISSILCTLCQWFERILTLLLLVYMTREFMKIFRYGWFSYLSSLYNVWELVIIGLSLSAVCVYWRRNVAVQEALFEV